MAVVPEEIITQEILIRLPPRSMVRFRCVCKLWNSLLYNPDYLTHLNCSLIISQNPPKEIRDNDCLISMYTYNNNIKDNNIPSPCDLFILSSGGSKQLSETRIDNNYVPYPLSLSIDYIHLVGSINGLVCMGLEVEGEHQFILWNPIIRFSKTILVPKHFPEEEEGLELKYSLGYGFGWDSVTNDYKLIIPPIWNYSSSAVVHSSNTNRWSYIKYKSTDIFSSFFGHPSVIVNGSPYWNGSPSPYWNDWQEDNPILKFDTRNNEFTSLDVPNTPTCSYSLINLNDCLALIKEGSSCKSTPTVYRFDEEHNIWMHMYTLAERVNIDWRWGDAVCFFKYGGEIVFHGKKHLYMYDPKSHKIKHRRHPRCRGCPLKSRKRKGRGSHDCEGFSHVNGVSYIPSLVTLQGMKALHL